MKCEKKPYNNPRTKAIITGVVEVLIPTSLWKRVKDIQRKNKTLTYTWITRYALFRLLRRARRETLTQNPKFRRLRGEDKSVPKSRSACHRHMVCFYGVDEETVHQLSLQLRVDISTLLRIALLWYLEELEAAGEIPLSFSSSLSALRRYAPVSLEKILYFGTKLVKGQSVRRGYRGSVPVKSFYRAILFSEEDFWWGVLGW